MTKLVALIMYPFVCGKKWFRKLCALLFIMLMLSGCGIVTKENKEEFKINGNVQFYGKAKLFEQTQVTPAFGGKKTGEVSIIQNDDGTNEVFCDYYCDKSVRKGHSHNGKLFLWYPRSEVDLQYYKRYQYVFKYSGYLYMAYVDESYGDLFLMISYNNGDSWEMMNNAQPILTHGSSESIFSTLYNPAICIDNNGVWHLFVECAPGKDDRINGGTAYLTATPSGNNINFDSTKQEKHILPRASNPYAEYSDGAIYLIYGQDINDEGFQELNASKIENNVLTKLDFKISSNGTLCDAHVTNTRSGLLLAYNYAQEYTFFAYANSVKTLADVFK